MPEDLAYFDPQPVELPERFASPFSSGTPELLAQRAIAALQTDLRDGRRLDAIDLRVLDEPGGGKMFGVLVVAASSGRVGYLRGFSGMLAGRWCIEGFVPPLFDVAARDAFWQAGEEELRELETRRRELMAGAEAVAIRAALDELDAKHELTMAEMRARHAMNRTRRHEARRALAEKHPTALHLLAQESRADDAERRCLDTSFRRERERPNARLNALNAARLELEQHRAERSRQLLYRLWDTYLIANARGERRPLRALFAPEAPPGGAGDCAAPKLLGHAYRLGLRPLALAEFWWGASPPSGDRRAGVVYPACRRNCGVILPYMLDGIEGPPVEAAPLYGAAAIADDEPRLVFEDEWIIVVDKPSGLLSVPGRHAQLRDSVQLRLRRRHPEAAETSVVHRLDLDTSGLLLAAKDSQTHAALQRQFARREVDKRYVAWLEGHVARDHGVIDLPLRVDFDDRPRQICDPIRGKPAVTEWHVLERTEHRTKVALFPRTGRTHQLRVHAAHPQGLNVPIVGDRLYGREDWRLLLHAEALGFIHPRTERRLTFERPAPF